MFSQEQLKLITAALHTAAHVSRQNGHADQAKVFGDLAVKVYDVAEGKARYKAHVGEITFKDTDVVNPGDFIPANDRYNPHKVRPFAIGAEFGLLAVAFASCEQDALDEAADSDKLDGYLVSPENLAKMTDDEQESLDFLGNASEPFDFNGHLWIVELPNPPFSFVALFNAMLTPAEAGKSSGGDK